MIHRSHSSLVLTLALLALGTWGGCSVDNHATGTHYVADSGVVPDGGNGQVPDSGKPGMDASHDSGGMNKQDASKPGKDADVEPDKDSSIGMDAGVDAYIPPPPPPPPRLEPHLAGGGFSQSQGFRLYHSVGAPRPTNSLTPRAMSQSAHYRLNSGLAVTTP